MMRTTPTALAIAALLLSSTPGHAAKPTPNVRACAITDPAGDVTVNDSPVHVSDDHLDLKGLDVGTSARKIALAVHTVATDRGRKGVSRTTFKVGRTPVFVTGGNGVWLNVGDGDTTSGFYAGVVGKRPVEVTGSIAANAVRITVPVAAFGIATLRRGTVLSAFAVEAKETLLTVAAPGAKPTEVALRDTMTSRVSYVVGGACRNG